MKAREMKINNICRIENLFCFYDKKNKRPLTNMEVKYFLWLNRERLMENRRNWIIKTYTGITYWENKEDYLNLLNKNTFTKIWKEGDIKNIKNLVNNVCWGKQENIEWLEKAILYKYLNPHKKIPNVVLYNIDLDIKILFMELLSKIFWEENTKVNLEQRNINMINWTKLVVEITWFFTPNTFVWTRLYRLLKNEEVEFKVKNSPKVSIKNITWFFIYSINHIPIRENDKYLLRKDISYINSKWKNIDNIREFKEDINNTKNIETYLQYLHNKYFNKISQLRIIKPLINEDNEYFIDEYLK